MWGAIEQKPGVYVWDDYDRQMDLAAKNGIKTVIAELIHAVPDWAYRKFAHARQLRADGRPLTSNMGVSAATGGFANNGGGAGALTLNCPEVKDAAGAFLTALATRYKGHPGLLGYDVWNEVNYSPDVDYSDWMKADFRKWLKAKYGDLETLGRNWYRYSATPSGTTSSRRMRSRPTRKASTGSPSSVTTTTARCSGASTPSARSTRTV